MEIHHIGYLVENIEAAMKKLSAMGFSVSAPQRNDERGVDVCFVQNGAYTMELVSPFRDDSDVSGLIKKCRNMMYHVCYISHDLRNDMAKLKKEGFIPISGVTKAPSIADSDVVFMYNSSIGTIELVKLNLKGDN